MVSKVDYDIMISPDETENIVSTPEALAQTPGDDDDDPIRGEQLIVYSEAGAATLDLPGALLEGVRCDTEVNYSDMSSHGDDEEERGDNAHVVTPLKVTIELDEFDRELNESIVRIQDISRERLWKFHHLPIIPPSSQQKERLFPQGPETEKLEPFIAPDPNELRELGIEPDGSLRRLNRVQLRGIRHDGTFEVPSNNFPGAVHCWRISQVLQKGRHRANEDLKHALARAYYFTFIIARNRVIGDSYSLKNAIKHFGYSIYFVYNLLVGGQLRISLFNRDSALLSYLMRGLKTDSTLSLTKKNRDKVVEHTKEMKRYGGHRDLQIKHSKVPHLYRNSLGHNVNVFSVSSSWISTLNESVRSDIFAKARDATKEKYPPKYVQGLIKEYQTQGASSEEITKYIRDRFDVDFLNELVVSFKEHPAINDVIPLGQGGVIESYLQGLKAVHVSIKNEKERIDERANSRIAELERRNSIRSKCDLWMEEQKTKARNNATVPENSFENIRQLFSSNPKIGDEWIYFLNICEEFNHDLIRIKKNITKICYDVETKTYKRKIWNPRSYIVTKIETGERIKDFPIIPKKEASNRSKGYHPRKFSISKVHKHEVTSKYPGWRWRNFFISYYTWLMDVLFVLLLGLVLKGPFSLSVLFLCYEHPTEYSLDSQTGEVYVSKRGKTMFTRLVGLWRTIRQKRIEFESRPDTGFLPKNITRPLNWFNYNIIWGVFGSILLVMFWIILCCFIINLGVVLILTLPIWFLLLRIFLVLVRWMFYDWEYIDPTKGGNSHGHIMPIFYLIFYKLFVRVFLQFFFAFSVICTMPIISFFWTIVALIFRITRFFWDAIMYFLIIKRRGRIPVTDSYVAKRISGPGLATNYYYQIEPSQALIKLEYDLESRELGFYENFMTLLIDQPRLAYVKFVSKVLSSFGYSNRYEDSNETYLDITKQKKELTKQLHKELKARRSSYTLNIPSVNLQSIRMTEEDLALTISVATEFVKEFYVKRILVYPSETMDKIFSENGLDVGDWENLAKIELKKSFSSEFLTRLEDTDESFHLQVNRLRLNKFLHNLRHGRPGHDLDRERCTLVEESRTFLPGIDLHPSYTSNWLVTGTQQITKYHPRTKKHESLLFPSYFNDKMTIFAFVGDNIGWDSIIHEVAPGESDDSDVRAETSYDSDLETTYPYDIALQMEDYQTDEVLSSSFTMQSD
ncbi:hypothetical protein LOD99_14301 [Oopsacas minuta]|uniref:Uncharacterized protein n=1 Tax=Oopsacas minuta TaxID=111878 RepID=A0AAV7KEV9_9METZ|nr:hypothetical protein LOD99_14301 [Oopsacas minuta]